MRRTPRPGPGETAGHRNHRPGRKPRRGDKRLDGPEKSSADSDAISSVLAEYIVFSMREWARVRRIVLHNYQIDTNLCVIL